MISVGQADAVVARHVFQVDLVRRLVDADAPAEVDGLDPHAGFLEDLDGQFEEHAAGTE